MKKVFAIFLLTIHLFNLAGYSFFFQYLIGRSNQQTVKQLDNNNYADANLVEVKIPINLPYSANWKNYERYDGEIEYNGTHYNYVKRKLSNDTLYVLCIQNQKKNELYSAKNSFTKQITDIPSGKKSNEPTAKKSSSLSEYNNQITQYNFDINAIFIKQQGIFISPLIISLFTGIPGQPPDTTA